jgi:hypothetical protein
MRRRLPIDPDDQNGPLIVRILALELPARSCVLFSWAMSRSRRDRSAQTLQLVLGS